jgi:hypothetical protein
VKLPLRSLNLFAAKSPNLHIYPSSPILQHPRSSILSHRITTTDNNTVFSLPLNTHQQHQHLHPLNTHQTTPTNAKFISDSQQQWFQRGMPPLIAICCWRSSRTESCRHLTGALSRHRWLSKATLLPTKLAGMSKILPLINFPLNLTGIST